MRGKEWRACIFTTLPRSEAIGLDRLFDFRILARGACNEKRSEKWVLSKRVYPVHSLPLFKSPVAIIFSLT